MKTAKEWLEDARLARQFERMMKGYEIYEGELENLAGGFWSVQVDNMQMAGLEPNEVEAITNFVMTDSKGEAANWMGVSDKWYATLFARACKKIDQMLQVTTKYCNFRGVS